MDKREAVLVDTDSVERSGARRTAWIKRSLETGGPRRIVQIIVRAEFDCAARSWTLERWYARTGSTRVDSEGILPEGERRPVPVTKGSAADRGLRALCASRT